MNHNEYIAFFTFQLNPNEFIYLFYDHYIQEEQNASSSANYDVEIIHSAEAHTSLRASQTPAEAAESVSKLSNSTAL